MEPVLYFMIGLPASGKSILAEELEELKKLLFDDVAIYSSDAIIEELFNDINDQSDNHLVFKTLNKRAVNDLKAGISVIYDAAGLSAKRRVAFLESLNKIDCHKIAIVMATPFNDCIDRDSKRDRTVGANAINRMRMQFEMPCYSEGWDEINVDFPNYDKSKYVLSDLFKILYTMPQHHPNHTKTVGHHCLSVMNYIFTKNGFKKSNLDMAGKLHDIGKLHTKGFKDMNGRDTISAHYYQHHNVSAYESMFYLDALGYSEKDIVEICGLITHHMRMHSAKTGKAINKVKRIVGEEMYEQLVLLHEADNASR